MNMSECAVFLFSWLQAFNNDAMTVTNHKKNMKVQRRRTRTPDSIHYKWINGFHRSVFIIFIKEIFPKIRLIIFDIWVSAWNFSFYICLFLRFFTETRNCKVCVKFWAMFVILARNGVKFSKLHNFFEYLNLCTSKIYIFIWPDRVRYINILKMKCHITDPKWIYEFTSID